MPFDYLLKNASVVKSTRFSNNYFIFLCLNFVKKWKELKTVPLMFLISFCFFILGKEVWEKDFVLNTIKSKGGYKMGFISRIKQKHHKLKKAENELATEIVEEKLEELNISLPGVQVNKYDKNARIKTKLKKELIYEIEMLIYLNKDNLIKNVA